MGVTLWPEEATELVPASAFESGRARAHTDYQTDPIGWAVDKLGIPEHTVLWSIGRGYPAHQWDGDVDPIAMAFAALRDWKDCAIESATGTGKSYAAAILILWFLACWEDSQVFTFALTADQLKLYIWRNITELWPRFSAWFPHAEITSLTIRMRGGTDDTWAAHGRPVQIRAGETVASRAQGMHARDMLLVYEEAAAMEWAILEAGRNTCTSPHNLRLFIGNPNHQLDSLHRVSQQSGVVSVRCSALDHPNVVADDPNIIPGATSRASIDSRRADYGESSPVFLSRVRGISPEQASDALIRLEWLRAAALRYEARKHMGTLPTRVSGKGVDVANSEHGDRAAICDFAENACVRMEAFACPDANQLGGRVVREAKIAGLPSVRVGVDAIGVGAGTVNEARRLGYVVQALYAGGSPEVKIERTEDGRTVEWSPDVNMFKTLRSQMYWQAREDLRLGRIDVIEDAELWAELTAPTFDDSAKVVIVEPKDSIKERLGRSPDKADAFVMANWVRQRAIVAEKSEVRKGQSPGYDYEHHRPRERETAEQALSKMLGRTTKNPLANRHRVPVRRAG